MPRQYQKTVADMSELLAEWDREKNDKLNVFPDKISVNSSKKVWWKCEHGHSWEAIVSNRVRLKRGCPYCAHQLPIIGKTDLGTTNPELIKEWHFEKNGTLKPEDFMKGSHKKVWWKCNNGHEWEAIIKNRAKGVGCPYCAGKKVVVGENDLATNSPELAKEWHPQKNGDLTPQQVSFGSGKKAWWICKNGHEFEKRIDARQHNPNCPICSARRRTSFPEQAILFYIRKAFHDAINSYRDIFKKKGGMELDIYIPSKKIGIEFDGKAFHQDVKKKVSDLTKYRICKENGIFLIRISDIFIDNFIKRCDYKIEIPEASDEWLNYAIEQLLAFLNVKYISSKTINIKRDRADILSYLMSTDKSLMTDYPDIAAEWNFEKNGRLKPEMFHPGSNERVWWKCKVCGHEWQTAIAERTRHDKTGCPKCARKKKGEERRKKNLTKKGSIAETHKELLNEWDYEKNTISPTDIVAGSHQKIWWKCAQCGHSWLAAVNHRTYRKSGCPYCKGKLPRVGVNDLATVNPHIARQWHPTKNGSLKPTMVLPKSSKNVWWLCPECGYEWQARIYSRTGGKGCPNCHPNIKKTRQK